MKNHIAFLILILALTCSSISDAQTPAPVDFLNINTATLQQVFDHKTKVRVKIININRFIYKVTEEKTEEDFNVTVPTILAGIKLPLLLKTQNPVPGTPAANINVVTAGKTAIQLQNDLEAKFKDLVRANRAINEAIEEHNAVVQLSKDCNDTFLQVQSKVETKLRAFLAKPGGDIPLLATEMEKLLIGKVALSNKIANDIEELSKALIERSLEEYKSNILSENDNLAVLNGELSKLYEDQKTTRPVDKPAIAARIQNKEKEIRAKSHSIKNLDMDFEIQKTNTSDIIEKSKSIVTEINKYNIDGNFIKLVDDIKKVNESNYTYYSETVLMKKDEYNFKINAVSDGPLTCNKPNEQKVEVVLRTRGGIKLDFSTGPFFMRGDKEFLNQSYYYKPISETETSIAIADKGKGLLLAIGALMHIYKRSPANFKIGGAVGVSSTFNFDVLNFHVGPSLIFGDKERVCLTFGITAREIDRLDKNYKSDIPYNSKLLPESIPTYKVFPKLGTFIALTYNFSRFNSK